MNNQMCLVTAASVLKRLSCADAGWGSLDLRVSQTEGLAAIEAYRYGRSYSETRIGGLTRDLPAGHHLLHAQLVPKAAVWYRGKVDVPLAELHRFMLQRPHGAMSLSDFREFINQGWVEPPRDGVFCVLVEDRSTELSIWTAWNLAGGTAVPMQMVVDDKARDPKAVYEGHWPLEEARDATVVVVGVGSIGSAAALGLVDYEIGNLVLIDFDRLRPHNIARHRCGPEDIGRYKVDAVADLIRTQSDANVRALRYSVIDHAPQIRPLIDDVDVVVCCADGVAARQAASQLCSTSATSAIFACVLENGALGEIVRGPARSDVGCLRCHRMQLQALGAMDPEPTLDLEYGTGTTHRPMTAIGGDLALVGQLAAKAAVTTFLEIRGYRDQRLAGNHLVIGLRPNLIWDAPFDQVRVLNVGAAPLPPPNPECPLCSGDGPYG